ncbi:hypothetical protein O9993_03330 [Vibrio lentus]|nr:hypothetical protein [Vibrio lentus]
MVKASHDHTNDILTSLKVEENKLELEIVSWFNLIKLFDPVRGAIKLWSMKKYPFDRRKRKSLKMSNSLVIARDFAKSCSNLAVTRPSSPTMARSDSSGINKQESHQASHCY